MVELDGDGTSPPFDEPALIAAVLQDARLQQRSFHRQAALRQGENAFDRPPARPHDDLAANDGLTPSSAAEPEGAPAGRKPVAGIVVGLHGDPIVTWPTAERSVDGGNAEPFPAAGGAPSSVGKFEAIRTPTGGVPLIVKALNFGPVDATSHRTYVR